MKTHFALTALFLGLLLVAVSRGEDLTLLDRAHLSATAGTVKTVFNFELVADSIPEGTIQVLDGPLIVAGGNGFLDFFSLELVGSPDHKVTWEGAGDKQTWKVYGLVPGRWVLSMFSLNGYRDKRLLFRGHRSSATLVTDVPSIMDANGWSKGAALQRKWLNSNKISEDNSIITVPWARNYSRFKKVYDSIFDSQLYANSAALQYLATTPHTEINPGLKGKSDGPFQAYCNRAIYEGRGLEACAGFDDFDAALNACTLHVWIDGELTTKGIKKTIIIRRVGVRIRDSFDFIDDIKSRSVGFVVSKGTLSQFLGYWNKQTNYAGCESDKGFLMVNKFYRDYRVKTGRGLDFMVMSPIDWKLLDKPVLRDLK